MVLVGISTLVMCGDRIIGVSLQKIPQRMDTTQSSGSFQINRSVYKLEEKVFLTVEKLQERGLMEITEIHYFRNIIKN